MSDNSYKSIRDLIAIGYRPISNDRARKLRKRGEFVYWNCEHNSYFWESKIVTGAKDDS